MSDWIHRERHVIAYCVFALFAVAGIYRVETTANKNRKYMCNFVVDLHARYQAGLDYRADVEEGRRPIIPGLTFADLQRSLDGQKATLESFRGLDCE